MLVAMNIEYMLLDLGHEVAGLANPLTPTLSPWGEGELSDVAGRRYCLFLSRENGVRIAETGSYP